MEASKKQLEVSERLSSNKKPESFVQADTLIKKSLSKGKKGLGDKKEIVSSSFPCFSQNYRDHNGAWKTVRLTVEELAMARDAHREHCINILRECCKDFPNDVESRIAVFDKRCDKVFSWIQQALDEKVRQLRK